MAAAIAAVLTTCALINHIVPDKAWLLNHFEAVYWLLMIVSLFGVFAIFHYAEYNRTKSWHGFPYRLFCLPVPTLLLISCPIVLAVISLEAVYWAWAKLVFAPLGRTITFWPAACAGVGMICYQAIVWGLAGFRITRIIVLALIGLVLANLGMVPLIEEVKIWPEKDLFRWARWLLALFSASAAFGAWFSVERQRHGGGRGKGHLKKALARILDALPRRTRGFSSPAAAQFWFEWRRSGQVLPLCVGAILLVVFLPLSWFTRNDPDAAFWILGWGIVLPTVLAGVIGKGFAGLEFWSGDLSFPTFLAIRPISSGEIVVTKLKVAALAVAVTWTMVLAFLSFYLALWADTKQLHELVRSFSMVYNPLALDAIVGLSIVAAVLLSWRMMVESLWVGLSGNLGLTIASAVTHLVTAVLVIVGLVSWNHHFWTNLDKIVHNFRWIGWAFVAAAVLKLLLATRSWKHISPRRVLKYVTFWWLATLCFVLLVLAIDPPFAALKHVMILAAFLPVPLARLGLAPSALAKNRHRK
jgi:hypothetical protein